MRKTEITTKFRQSCLQMEQRKGRNILKILLFMRNVFRIIIFKQLYNDEDTAYNLKRKK